jgi:hypothetical protein
MEQAVSAAIGGDLVEAVMIASEDLPASLETADGQAAYASRMAGLAFRLQNIDRNEDADAVADLALDACGAFLASAPKSADPKRTARYLKLSGILLRRTPSGLNEAKEAFLLAYRIDPEGQIESLRFARALEERERVIAERRAAEERRKEPGK